MISETRDQPGDDEDDTRDGSSAYSDEGSTDDDSRSDYGNVKYSEDDDSTNDGNSDGYGTDESRGRSKERKNAKVASKGRLNTPLWQKGRFPIAIASRKK
jgi:hypothetical protein